MQGKGELKPYTLTEVAVRYQIAGKGLELSFNPANIPGQGSGSVQTVIWDNRSWELYWLGLGRQQPNEDLSELKTERLQVEQEPAQVYAFGVNGEIRYQRKGQWLTAGKCIVSLVIYRYTTKEDRHFEVVMPANSLRQQDNVTPKDLDDALTVEMSKLSRTAGYDLRFIGEGVHALFWRKEDCEAYRRGLMQEEKQLSEILEADAEGRYSKHPETYQLFRPSYPAPRGRYASCEARTCKHFNNCDWDCGGQH
jgi:hypothetical protein